MLLPMDTAVTAKEDRRAPRKTDAASEGGVGDWMLIMIPEDVLWRLRTVLDKTCEVHCESFLQINVRTSQYLSIRF